MKLKIEFDINKIYLLKKIITNVKKFIQSNSMIMIIDDDTIKLAS